MKRLAVGIALASSLFVTVARAESQAEIAAKENEEGKTLMFAGNYKDATEKFRSAADRAPEAKYYFNLCTSIYQQGIFGRALTACNAADNLNPDDKLKGKIAKLEEKIKSDAAAQHIDLNPTGTGGGGGPENTGSGAVDPNSGGNVMGSGAPMPPQQPPQYAVGRPTQDLLAKAKPEHNYTWSLGIDLFGGGAHVGDANQYGTAAGGFRLKGDYMLSAANKFGAEVYLQITNIADGNNAAMLHNQLDIFDFGVALYKHLCLAGVERLCLTPLAGLQLALMDPNASSSSGGTQYFNYSAFGVRGQISADFAIGSRYEHVISVMLGVNAYTKVLSAPSDCVPGVDCAMDVGLNTGGPVGYLGLGYTYRFNTPFGQAPFVSLE